jgi:hypothetical protein
VHTIAAPHAGTEGAGKSIGVLAQRGFYIGKWYTSNTKVVSNRVVVGIEFGVMLRLEELIHER